MNDEKLTYILLIIASLFLILNGVFAFEHNLIIIFNVHIFHFNWHYFIYYIYSTVLKHSSNN